ncbi:gluconate 5-dehydrogenase [bacterium]|nr:gluconate 5-dehydrogenase [bacterium]|tara:strand:- start:17955 stop:18785 length:831 start_codon:yes stop_codon:yes gene_type:complete
MKKEKPTIDITNKTVLLTGSTGYFGQSMACAILDNGGDVILLARDKSKLDKQREELSKKYGKTIPSYCVDFYDTKKLKETLLEISQKHSVDALVNNAYDLSEKTGFNTKKGTLETIGEEEWTNAFQSGLYAAFLTIQVIGENMKKNGGSIINISSMYGSVSPDPGLYEGKEFLNPPTYSVMKAGVLALTRYVASFWAPYGIRCNAISPGSFPNTQTNSTNSVSSKDTFLERLEDKTVLGKVGEPTDLTGALLFLISDASSYMTGNTIAVDGGWTTL